MPFFHFKKAYTKNATFSGVKKPYSSVFGFASICIFFFAAYFPVLTDSWAYHDDYNMWRNPSNGVCENFLMFRVLTGLGRSVGAYSLCGIWKLVHDFSDARVAHFLMVLLLSVFAWIFFLWLKKHSISKIHAMLLTGAIFTLPTFQSQTAYILSSVNTLGALLSACAAIISYKALFNTLSIARKTILIFIAVGILFTVTHIHTSAGLFFWPMISVPLICAEDKVWWKEKWRYISLIIINIAAQLSYYLVYTLLYVPLYKNDYGGNIYKTVPVEKILWFFYEPLLNALNLWNIFPTWYIGVLVAIVIIAGLFISMRTNFIHKDVQEITTNKPSATQIELVSGFSRVALLLSLLPLSVAPYLVIQDDLCFYRGLIGLGPLIVLLLFYSIRSIQCLFSNSNSKKVTTGFLVAACFSGAYFAYFNIKTQIIYPQKVEISYIKKILAETDLNPIRRIHVIGNPEGVPLYGKAVRGDEFGTSPTSFPWDVEGIIRASLLDLKKENENQSFIVTHGIDNTVPVELSDEPTSFDVKSILVIDMRK